MTDIEDRSRRNNVRLVGLPEGAEGPDAAGFLRANLSKWIPSLKDRDIEIDRAHRVYDGRKNSDRPRTLIFRVLRWHDRSEILKGAQQAYPMKCTQDNVTLLFFPDFSPATAARRKALFRFWTKMTVLGLQPFLTYPAVIKTTAQGWAEKFQLSSESGGFYQLPVTEEDIYCGSTRQRENGGHHLFCAVGGAWWPGWRRFLLPGRKWWQGVRGYLLNLKCFLLSSLLLGYCSYLSGTTVSLLVRLIPPFFFFFSGGD